MSVAQLHEMGISEPNIEIPPGNAKRGRDLFKKKCAACHTVEKGGSTKGGPNLYAFFGKGAGTNPDFQRAKSFRAVTGSGYKERYYSDANRESGIVWSDQGVKESLYLQFAKFRRVPVFFFFAKFLFRGI